PVGNKLELRFRDEYAGVQRLSERVFGLKIQDEKGNLLRPEILGDGVYRVALREAQQIVFSYQLRLSRVLDPGQYALVSSLGAESGLILLSDALPQINLVDAKTDHQSAPLPVRLQISLPNGWQASTTESKRDGFYEITEPEQAVFFIGRLRTQTHRVGEMQIESAIAGNWNFSDEQASKLVEAIAREQAAMIAGQEQGKFLVTLAPFPLPLTGLRSTALTRNKTVILLVNSDSGNDSQARTLKLFQKHLAHEMFHFYLPGAFQIAENFDWFWEGFTRYTALITLLRLGLINTRDYFDELGQEFEAYAINPARTRLSLLAASTDKFASRENYDLVYRKGTLVAALFDLSLRWQSDGKKNLNDVLRSLYKDYAHKNREIGNREVLEKLQQAGDFQRFIADYISGTREIDLAVSIKPYGWIIEQSTMTRGQARINITKKLSDKQLKLVGQLGQK
ncbi:MAG TPA: hypothetical protein VEF04_08255, partial [Blastocatellia bacterium]|nr:hypothetical protein [Blastocatellia bacterium]